VWVPAYLLRSLKPAPKPRPAIVALHGHGGRWGKVTVAGVAAEDPQVEERIALYNYDYGLQFARRGYVVLCPDARVFGERAAGWWNPPEPAKGFDPCDRAGNKASLLGYSLVALTTWDDRRGLDYLQTRDDVDANRIGAAGLSLGGARSLFLAALDDRVRATVISGCLCTYLAYALRQQFCGGQFVHGLLRWADLPDVAALIAPRPLLIEAGLDDDIFPIDASREAHRVLEAAYRLLDAEQKLWRDEFPGGHRWSGARAYDFMEQFLPCNT
jgi:dienelactone hydrolase